MRTGDDATGVAILAVPGVFALDVSIPEHVFSQHPGYRVLVCGEQQNATQPLSAMEFADIVVVPGYENPHRPIPEEYAKALRAAVGRGARVVAVCTGVFALAAGGMLEGRAATTHWHFTDQLRAAYPGVEVVKNRLFVEDGAFLTSAGAGSGIDACLHGVQADFGVTAADRVARAVVFPSARGAEEPQYAEVPATPAPRASLRSTREWVIGNLGSPITVQRLADHSLLSRRTLIRRFERETGMPPMRWVTEQRIRGARRLLEGSDWTVERIAAATGFGTAANFRAVFRREVGTTPSAYRKAYRA